MINALILLNQRRVTLFLNPSLIKLNCRVSLSEAFHNLTFIKESIVSVSKKSINPCGINAD